MSDIFVIGLCGESIFKELDHITKAGETLISKGIARESGGKGFNQAIVAARMGETVSFMSAVGDDNGMEECEKCLERNGVKPILVKKEGRGTAYACIFTDKNGENCVTEYLDAELDVHDVENVRGEIARAKYLILQNEVPAEVNRKACKIAEENGVKIVYNPAPAREEVVYLRDKAELVIPNEHEAEAIKCGEYKNCIKTLGAKGCIINDEIEIPSIKVKAVDTTGAGDTFCGALTAFLNKGKTLEEAARYAVIASGISVTRKYVVNAYPSLAEVLNYI